MAQLINYAVTDWSEGWRLSLGLAAVPALMLLLGGLCLPESPNSLLERGRRDEALAVLRLMRGVRDVDVSRVGGSGWCRGALQREAPTSAN